MRQQNDSLWTSYPNFTFQVAPPASRTKSLGCVPLGSSRRKVYGGFGGATFDGLGSCHNAWADAVPARRKKMSAAATLLRGTEADRLAAAVGHLHMEDCRRGHSLLLHRNVRRI